MYGGSKISNSKWYHSKGQLISKAKPRILWPLKTCLNLFRFNMIRIVTIQYDLNCYDSYDSQTCLNLYRFNMIWIVTIQYDTNCYDSYDSQTCLNLFRFKWFIWFSNMSKLVLNCNTKFCKIWVNGTKCKD